MKHSILKNKKEIQQKKVWDVVVIGAGPAGMMAAGKAASRGKSVLLLEKNSIPGKKLLITGGGRCNVTNNTPDIRKILLKYKENGKFLFSAFSQFAVTGTIDFFNERGVEIKEEAEGRMFPISNKAQTIWDALIEYIKEEYVTLESDAHVEKVSFNKNEREFEITLKKKSSVYTRACIIATGGTSRPETGSNGEGFTWLKQLGHTIIENDVALVPIALRDTWIKKAAGVSFKDVKMTSYKDGVKQKVYKGKLLFTHFGISGPTVLNMSREVGDLLHKEGSEYERKSEKIEEDKKGVIIVLDLFPHSDEGSLRKEIQTLLQTNNNKKIKNTLSLLIPPALVQSILELSSIDPETQNHNVRTHERKQLVLTLKNIRLHVSGLLGKDKAVVSSGGVALPEVDFKSMQSKIIPGLYLVGDVLNINRPSGGYSLQLCWTTGFVAGSNC